MEEKDRFELFGEHCIKDNSPDARPQLLGAYVACVILNEQDKRIKELEQENAQLKQQLAEKEKEIEKLTEELDYKNFWNDFVDLYTGNKLKTQMLNENCKDKISFAVEQLELARRRIDRLGYNENKCLNKKDCIEDCLEEIDNQIKELKGEK